MITNSADATFSDTETMSGHVVIGLGEYGQSLHSVKGSIDDYLRTQEANSHD